MPLSPPGIANLISTAKHAGRVIMDIYATDFSVTTKDDQSPVTQADQRADDVIVAALKTTIRTPFAIITEETFQTGVTTVDADQPFWLVDPLDGTKQFVNRRDEFTVNIALIDKRRAVFGVVHAPALNLTYWGGPDGAFAQTGNDAPRPITVRPRPAGGITAVVSRSHRTPETDAFLDHFTVTDAVSCGSSLKLCRIADGDADLYPRFGRTMEWDIAAGHAVLSAAGGHVVTSDGQPLRYAKPGFENPNFAACSHALIDDVRVAFS